MSLYNNAGDSSGLPTSRSRVDDDQELEVNSKLVALYKVDQDVYIKGPRGVNPNVHKVHRALDDGQYELSRDGKVVLKKGSSSPEIFLEEKLQTHQ